MNDNKITEKDITYHLKNRFCQPEWAFFSQVRSSTGSANRIADGIAVNMYASRGYEINGFEIKVSRSDWLNELKRPHKAEEIFNYCDKWWLVVPDKNIVQDGELPKDWGLMVLQKNGVVVKKRAEYKEHEVIDLGFIAALLRRAVVDQNRMIYKDEIDNELKKEFKRGQDDKEYVINSLQKKIDNFEEIIKTFEKETGVQISRWYGKEDMSKIAKIINRALQGEKFDIKWNLDSLVKNSQEIVGKVQKLKDAIK